MTGIALVAEYAATAVHHAYGGVIYHSPERLFGALIAVIPLLITLGLLSLYKRTSSGVALTLFSMITILFWVILIGLFEGYSHALKDLLFLAHVPSATMHMLYRPFLFVEVIYPPTDVFFEITGVLTLVAASFLALFTYRLIRERIRGTAVEVELSS
jgi:hypothetical protein